MHHPHAHALAMAAALCLAAPAIAAQPSLETIISNARGAAQREEWGREALREQSEADKPENRAHRLIGWAKPICENSTNRPVEQSLDDYYRRFVKGSQVQSLFVLCQAYVEGQIDGGLNAEKRLEELRGGR